MTAHYLLPAGTINNRTAYFYADSTKQFGPVVKKVSDQILVIIDYKAVLSGQIITGYKFTSDVESNPPLYVTDPLINSTGDGLSFLVSGGIDGQQYNITVGLNPNIVSGTVLRNDILTINMPSKSACDALIPPMVTLLGSNSYVSTAIHFYWGPNPPTGQFVLDQWFNTDTRILYEWITDGMRFFWEEIGEGVPIDSDGGGQGGTGNFVDAPADSVLYSRRNHLWIADPIQVDATSDGKIWVRNDGDWIPDPLQVDAPADGQVWGRQDNQWAVLMGGGGGPSVVPPVPIVFIYPGKPPVSQVINIPMSIAISVPSGLAGSFIYASAQATANAVFTLKKITSSGAITTLGTMTVAPISHTSVLLSGAGGALGLSDTLQLSAPATQDLTLTDVSLTILVTRT